MDARSKHYNVVLQFLCAGLFSITSAVSAVQAQEADALAEIEDSSTIKIDFVVDAWMPRLRGDTTIGGTAPPDAMASFEDDLGFDQHDFAPHATAHLKQNRMNLWLSGFTFDDNGRSHLERTIRFDTLLIAPAGSDVRTEIDYSTVAFEIGYDLSGIRSSDGRSRATVGFLGGIRYIDIGQRTELVSLPGSPLVERGARDVAAFAGARFEVEVVEQIVATARFGVGTTLDSGGDYFQVEAAIRWFPVENVGVTAGYRLIGMEVEDGDFLVNARLAGVFLGLSLRF
ncbi:MAG: hypothetical protein ACR2GY_03790 [Phycisphaerales bacterium]